MRKLFITVLIFIVSCIGFIGCGSPYPEPDDSTVLKLTSQLLMDKTAKLVARCSEPEYSKNFANKYNTTKYSTSFYLHYVDEWGIKSDTDLKLKMNKYAEESINGFTYKNADKGTEYVAQILNNYYLDTVFTKLTKYVDNVFLNPKKWKFKNFETIEANEKSKYAIYKAHYDFDNGAMSGEVAYKAVKTSDGNLVIYLLDYNVVYDCSAMEHSFGWDNFQEK